MIRDFIEAVSTNPSDLLLLNDLALMSSLSCSPLLLMFSSLHLFDMLSAMLCVGVRMRLVSF